MEENNTLETQATEGQERTYSQAEVDELLQKEGDRRVSNALKKAEEKKRKEVREAQKLAQMDADQRIQYELEQRERELDEKERRLILLENTAEASKILSSKGLSLELVEFVVAEDAESMSANIAKLEKAFKASVKAEVEKRLGSATPKKDLPPDTVITKEAFAKMTVNEQYELYKNNPEIYKTLTS